LQHQQEWYFFLTSIATASAQSESVERLKFRLQRTYGQAEKKWSLTWLKYPAASLFLFVGATMWLSGYYDANIQNTYVDSDEYACHHNRGIWYEQSSGNSDVGGRTCARNTTAKVMFVTWELEDLG
jgi:hypothetical protein